MNHAQYRYLGKPVELKLPSDIKVTPLTNDTYVLEGTPASVGIAVATSQGVWVHYQGRPYFIEKVPQADKRRRGHAHAGGSDIVAPMPGKIIRLAVEPDDTVKKGDLLCILEAMKMEHRFVAPQAGKVTAVYIQEGDIVEAGKQLVDLE